MLPQFVEVAQDRNSLVSFRCASSFLQLLTDAVFRIIPTPRSSVSCLYQPVGGFWLSSLHDSKRLWEGKCKIYGKVNKFYWMAIHLAITRIFFIFKLACQHAFCLKKINLHFYLSALLAQCAATFWHLLQVLQLQDTLPSNKDVHC